jgi:hypothetical protein
MLNDGIKSIPDVINLIFIVTNPHSAVEKRQLNAG